MSDRYSTSTPNLVSPAIDGFAIAPSDTADLPEITRAIYIGVGGDVVGVTKLGSTLTFANVAAGTVLPVRLKAVKAAGTTAQSLLGLV
jgi:hypothetical protein